VTEPTPHDDALAQRLRSGDREALGVLYDRYASLALGTALRVVADREVAEDLVHDAFVAVWRKIDKFDPGRGSLRSWLLTVVRNRAIDRVRGARQTIEVGEADAQSLLRSTPNPTWEAAVQRLSAAELRGAIEALPGVTPIASGIPNPITNRIRNAHQGTKKRVSTSTTTTRTHMPSHHRAQWAGAVVVLMIFTRTAEG